jgi:hypothetical protein
MYAWPGTKPCSGCHVEKPLDQFYRRTRSRDGRQAACIPCTRSALDTADERHRAARPLRVAPAVAAPAGAPRLPALSPQAAPLPRTKSLRDYVEERARKDYSKIADTLVSMAVAGDRAMMGRLLEYLLGKPQGATDDRGPERFLRLLMAANPALNGGDGAELGETAADTDSDVPNVHTDG